MGNSERGIAKHLKIHRKTVERKILYLAKKAHIENKNFLRARKEKVKHLQFDDLITIEHTKLKPLSVSLAVDAQTRHILGAQVSRIGAFGHPAALIESDEHKRYPEFVAKYLPNREYKRFKGGRGCIAGQGE